MKFESKTIITILVIAILLLAAGEVYTLVRIQSKDSQPNTPSSQLQSGAIAPSTILTPQSGTVQSADASHIVLASGNGSSTTNIAIDSSTTIVAQGALKDSTQQSADMEAFRQSSNALAQDPQKNQFALSTLIAPSPYIETPIKATSIAAGSQVTVYTMTQAGAPRAIRVVVVAPAH